MADIVLIQPMVGDWDGIRSHPSVPLSLLSASRLVTKQYHTVLIDTRINKNWKVRLKKELARHPICIGITSITGRQIKYALEISRFIKGISNVAVVWGGIHGSLLPESTLRNKNIDIVVIGEGEVTFLEVVKALANKSSLRGIAGVWYREDSQIIKNPIRPFVNLDTMPELPLSLIDIKRYLPTFRGRRTFYIETSRGCPNQCRFCYNAIYNKSRWRAFPAETVIRELKRLSERFNIKSFYVVDDNFFVDLARALTVAEGIIKEKLDILWEVQGITVNSALKMDEKYLELLVRSGMRKVHFGVETASEKILRMVNKNIRIKDVIEINRRWSKFDIIIQYNFMCGFPGESVEDIRQTKDLIFQLMRDNVNALISPICPYTPYPGTALYEKALSEGFIQKNTLEDWQEADYGDNLWESRERREFLSALFFASMFLDKHRSRDMVSSPFLKILIGLYRPIARLRVKHLFFKFMPELKIKNSLFR